MIISKDDKKLEKIKNRASGTDIKYEKTVIDILSDVRKSGDQALFKYSKKFDNFELTKNNIRVTEQEIDKAESEVTKDFIDLLNRAKDNILKYHKLQLEKSWFIENEHHSMLGQKITALARVGVYVPGGKASYFSSVLMNTLPAVAAGVKEIIMTTPAVSGIISPNVIVAAKLAGVTEIYKVGGAQAIAALAYGTKSIKKVDKIVGPGNIYVALAKKHVYGTVDIDMIAGPSEILIVADKDSDPKHIAADMLAQAEHDELASSICITDNKQLAKAIEIEINKQLKSLSRKNIATSSIKNYGAIIIADSIEEAIDISNDIAPEHLELSLSNPLEYLRYVKNAGAIFLGGSSPEAAGDYYAGPNHVLPTGGSAKFFSPLGTYDFIKRSSIIYYTKEQLMMDSDDIIKLATLEGLQGHARSIQVRK